MLKPSQSEAVTVARGFAGAIAGAVLGWFAFAYAIGAGFYAVALIGALIGLGCGLATGRRSLAAGIAAAVIALPVSLVAEWHEFPFRADAGFAYFMTHLHQKSGVTLFMLALSVVFGSWFGVGRNSPAASAAEKSG